MQESSETSQIIYNARKNLFKQLDKLGYDVSSYENNTINEVHTMVKNKQLDMKLEKTDQSKKIYINFHLGKTLRLNNISDLIDDLIDIEEVLTKNDDIIIIIKDEPNDTIMNIVKEIWENQKIFVVVMNIKRLQFNILDHILVPEHIILNDEEVETMKRKYNITNEKIIPEISRFDPVALAINMRPGQICKIMRDSKTAIKTDIEFVIIYNIQYNYMVFSNDPSKPSFNKPEHYELIKNEINKDFNIFKNNYIQEKQDCESKKCLNKSCSPEKYNKTTFDNIIRKLDETTHEMVMNTNSIKKLIKNLPVEKQNIIFRNTINELDLSLNVLANDKSASNVLSFDRNYEYNKTLFNLTNKILITIIISFIIYKQYQKNI